MVRTLKEKDIPEPWFGKKSKQATFTPAQTRAASKQMAHHQDVDDDIVEEPSAKGETREKGKCKDDMRAKGKKKAMAVRPGTAEVVMGRSKYAVPDPEELRRKMIADAEACGRVVKSLSTPASRKSCATTSAIGTPEGRTQLETITGEVPPVMEQFGSPIPAIPDAEEGSDKHAEEYGNEVEPPVTITASGARSGKESGNEERQRASECALGVHESGKRKAMRHVVINSTSPERSDPGESAQKRRRVNRSPSPIILQERVSHSLVHLSSVQFRVASGMSD